MKWNLFEEKKPSDGSWNIVACILGECLIAQWNSQMGRWKIRKTENYCEDMWALEYGIYWTPLFNFPIESGDIE